VPLVCCPFLPGDHIVSSDIRNMFMLFGYNFVGGIVDSVFLGFKVRMVSHLGFVYFIIFEFWFHVM